MDNSAAMFSAGLEALILKNPAFLEMFNSYSYVSFRKFKWFFKLDAISYDLTLGAGTASKNSYATGVHQYLKNVQMSLCTDIDSQPANAISGNDIINDPHSKCVKVGGRSRGFVYTPDSFYRRYVRSPWAKECADDVSLSLFFRKLFSYNAEKTFFRCPSLVRGSIGGLFKDTDLAPLFNGTKIGLRYVLTCTQYATCHFRGREPYQ